MIINKSKNTKFNFNQPNFKYQLKDNPGQQSKFEYNELKWQTL